LCRFDHGSLIRPGDGHHPAGTIPGGMAEGVDRFPAEGQMLSVRGRLGALADPTVDAALGTPTGLWVDTKPAERVSALPGRIPAGPPVETLPGTGSS
jgi:hypothetical protein